MSNVIDFKDYIKRRAKKASKLRVLLKVDFFFSVAMFISIVRTICIAFGTLLSAPFEPHTARVVRFVAGIVMLVWLTSVFFRVFRSKAFEFKFGRRPPDDPAA